MNPSNLQNSVKDLNKLSDIPEDSLVFVPMLLANRVIIRAGTLFMKVLCLF